MLTPAEAVPLAAQLATHTQDPLYASAVAYLAPLLTDPARLDHPQTRNVLNFVARGADAYLALYGKPLLDE